LKPCKGRYYKDVAKYPDEPLVILDSELMNSEAATDENGLFDARGRDLTLIVTIDRRVGLSLRVAPLWGSCGERV